MEGKFYTAGALIKALRKFPSEMRVSFYGSAGYSFSPQMAYQICVWTSKGGLAKKPYSAKCHAVVYTGDEQP